MIGRLYGLGPAEARRRSDDVLERIGLTDAARRKVGTYSGGMRKRLDVAASLVGRPEVMFLDEPTTGIDPRSRMDVWDLVEDLVVAGTTVLLTTQYLEEADRLADRIGVIDLGRIVSEGTADELKDTLGGAVLELAIHDDERESAMATLAQVTGDTPVADSSGTRIRVPARDGSQTLLTVVRALDAAGLTTNDIALHRPTLDDVFLALTGDRARTSQRAEEAAARRARRRTR